MPASSAAKTLAGVRIATAALCAAALAFGAREASPIMGPHALLAAAFLYGLSAVSGLLPPRWRLDWAGTVALGWDCAFIGAMFGAGQAGALALPLAVLILGVETNRRGPRRGFLAGAIMTAAILPAALWAPFWSTHPVIVLAVAGLLLAVAGGVPAAAAAAPVARSPAEPAIVARREIGATHRAPDTPFRAGREQRILLADPAATSRIILQKVLTRAGYTVIAESEPAAVMEILADPPSAFGALVIDAALQDAAMDELIRPLRTKAADDALRLIVLHANDASREAARECDLALARPIDFSALLAGLERAPLQAGAAPAEDVATSNATPATAPAEHPAEQAQAAVAAPPGESAADGPAIDLRALRDLESLGGQDFVREIVNQFIVDGAGALRNLARVTIDGDVELFRDQAHALRSSAANVGARGIYETCLAWRAIAPEDLARDGAAHMRTLNHQFQEAAALLEGYIARLDERAEGASTPVASNAA